MFIMDSNMGGSRAGAIAVMLPSGGKTPSIMEPVIWKQSHKGWRGRNRFEPRIKSELVLVYPYTVTSYITSKFHFYLVQRSIFKFIQLVNAKEPGFKLRSNSCDDSFSHLALEAKKRRTRYKRMRALQFFKKLLFIRGEEGERERNIDVREKHWSVASRTRPIQGPNQKPRHVP